jgi:hypothetical protein
MSVPVLLLGKPLFFYWLYRGGKGLRRHRVSLRCVQPLISYLLSPHGNTDDMAPPLPSQGYERVRRASEEDGAPTPQYDEDEEEGIEELPSREAAATPKQVSTCGPLPATWQHDSNVLRVRVCVHGVGLLMSSLTPCCYFCLLV